MNARLRRPAVALITTTLAASVLGIVPAAQAAEGTVSGTVSGPDGGFENLTVDLYEYVSYDGGGFWTETEHTDQTDSFGAYSIAAPAGEYRVRFDNYDADYAFEFYEDATTVEAADTITVPSAAAEQVDAVLGAASHVSGEVTDPDGQPLDDIAVSAYQVVGTGSDTEYRYVGFAVTDAGTYELGGLADGTYVVEFEEFYPDVPTYATEYYNDQPNEHVAERITLADGATKSADAQLELGSDISGAVTGENGAAVDYGYATALVEVGSDWLEVGYGEIQPNGSYVIDGLAADTYRVRFGAEVGGRYVEEYWDNQGDVSTATDVVLGVDDSEINVSAVLIEGEHEPVYPVVENLTAPVISGTPQVGSPLTSSAGTWSPNPTLVEYYWVAGDDLVQGGTSPTYVPTAADLGKVISVYVYASAEGYDYGYSYAVAPGAVVAAPVPPVVAPAPTPPAPVVDVPAGLAAIVADLDVKGKPKVGKTVKVTGLDMLLRTAVTYKFKWFAGTKKIKKATKSKLKITRAMKGKKISVKVTATAASTSKSVKIKVGRVK